MPTRRFPLIALFVASLLAQPAWGEFVFLKSGGKIEGKIVKRTDASLVIETNGGRGRVTIPIGSIEQIIPVGSSTAELVGHGRTLLDRNQPEQALRTFELAISRKPGSASALHGKTLALARLGHTEQALRSVRSAILLDPDVADYRITLAGLQARTGQYARAERELRHAMALEPHGPQGARAARALASLEHLRRNASLDTGLAHERKTFDHALGNNGDAAEIGALCLAIRDRLHPGLPLDVYCELQAPDEVKKNFARGGRVEQFRAGVRVAQVSAMVDPVAWARLRVEERKALVSGWLLPMKDRYPFATCIAVVASRRRIVLEAIWSDLRHDVIFHTPRR